MSYQFDPNTAARCWPHRLPSTQEIFAWVLRDGAPIPWVSLNGVCAIIDVSARWVSAKKWDKYFVAHAHELGLERFLDDWLAPAPVVPDIICAMEDTLPQGNAVRSRAGLVRSLWAAQKFDSTPVNEAGEPLGLAEAPVVPRKVSPELIERLYALHQAGKSHKEKAAELGISDGLSKRIGNGRHKKHMNAACLAAWAATFGNKGRKGGE